MARPIWAGTLSFGLLNIPVSLMPGERRADLHFRMLDARNNAAVRYERVNAETGEEVPWKDIVKAFEYKKGSYVVLEPEDVMTQRFLHRSVTFLAQRKWVDASPIGRWPDPPRQLAAGKAFSCLSILSLNLFRMKILSGLARGQAMQHLGHEGRHSIDCAIERFDFTQIPPFCLHHLYLTSSLPRFRTNAADRIYECGDSVFLEPKMSWKRGRRRLSKITST